MQTATSDPSALVIKDGRYYGNVDKDFEHPLDGAPYDFLNPNKSGYDSQRGKATKETQATKYAKLYIVRQCKETGFDGQVVEIPSSVKVKQYERAVWRNRVIIPGEMNQVSEYQSRLGLKMKVLHDPTKE